MTLQVTFERNRVSGEQDIHFQKLSNFPHIFLLCTAFEEFKRLQFEGILDRIKINGMVNNHLSTCNS